MIKRVHYSLMVLVTLVTILPTAAAVQSDTPPRRVISLVYDDSGSMYQGTKWASTNYAMQTFMSLLDDEVELYVTYLSDYNSNIPDSARKQNLASSQRRNTIDSIRSFPGRNVQNTPFAAVVTAKDLLARLPTEPSTEYWLVVLTDGIFNDLDPNTSYGTLLYQVQEELRSQGKDCKVMYIAIGSNAVPIPSNELKGFYSAITSEQDITSTLASMASLISGVAQASSDALLVSGSTLTVSSSLLTAP